MNRIIILILVFIFQSYLTFSQCAIAGHLYDKEKKQDMASVEVRLLGSSSTSITSTYSDSHGNYHLGNIPEGRHDFLFFAKDYKDTIVYNIQFVKDSTTNVNILFPMYCEYSTQKSICPKCQRRDMIIPIVYGFPNDKMRKKSLKGLIRLGGCSVTGCDPKWFCKRDKIEF